MNRDVRKSHWCKVATRRDWLVGAFVVACLLVGSHLIWGAVQFDGEQNGESQVSASAVAASEGELARSAPPGAELFTKPIQEIEVGERVWAENPTGEEDLSLGVEVEPATWRRLELRAPKEDGTWAEVVLLRPEWWLEEQAELNDKDTLEVGDGYSRRQLEAGRSHAAKVLKSANMLTQRRLHVLRLDETQIAFWALYRSRFAAHNSAAIAQFTGNRLLWAARSENKVLRSP